MNQDYFADPEEVSQYLNASSALFGDEKGNVLPLDTGAVMHRQVSNQDASTPFIDWFVQNVVSALEQPGTLKKENRVFFVSGRAGQGKSTVLRKLFLAILGQWEEEPRERPNFSAEMDTKLSAFFNYWQDSTFFAQGRALPTDVTIVGSDTDRNLIFIDGLDESTRQLQFISALINQNPNSVFVISSRSKYDDLDGDKVINIDILKQHLSDAGSNVSISSNIAHLSELTQFEKNNMFDLLKRFDGHGSYGMLESLAKNNSPLLQRPADFLLFRAKKPTTKSQYYIEHLSWLLRREMAKDEDRKERVKSLRFPRFLDKLELSNQKLRMKYNSDETSSTDIESMVLFNLIEQDWSGENAENYLDITTPASRGILLLESSGKYTVQDLVKHADKKLIDVEHCVNEFVFGDGKDCFTQMIDYVIGNEVVGLSKQRLHEILSTILSGEVESSENSKFFKRIQSIVESMEAQGIESFSKMANLTIFLADVFHPVDELSSEINIESYAPILIHSLNSVYKLQKIYTNCQTLLENGNTCNAQLLEPHSWPSQSAMDKGSLCCPSCSHNTKVIGTEWFAKILPPYASLIARISQIGPHYDGLGIPSSTTAIFADPAEYLSQNPSIEPSFAEIDFVQSVRIVLARYQIEINNYSFDEILKPLRLCESYLPKYKNKNTLKRSFTFVNSILGLPDYNPKGENSTGMFMIYRRLKTHIYLWMEPNLTYPADWDPNVYCRLNFKDIVSSHYSLMGSDSMNSDKIVQFFIDDGINPYVTYPGLSPTIQARMNTSMRHKVYHADVPMRSAKFVGKALREKSSADLESILQGLVTISRIGHLNPRDSGSFYSTNIDAELGEHAYANPNNPQGILSDLIDDQIMHWPNVPKSVPPSLTKSPRRNKKFTKPLKKGFSSHLRDEFRLPSQDINRPYYLFKQKMEKYLRALDGDYRIFLEAVAASAPFFANLEKPLSKDKGWRRISEKLSITRKTVFGFHRYLEEGEFFPATLLSLRTNHPHIASILCSIELPSGFSSRKNLFIGNYLNRRIWSGDDTVMNHDPNNRDFFHKIAPKEKKSFESYVPTFHDPVHILYKDLEKIETSEDDRGQLWLSFNTVRDLSYLEAKKVKNNHSTTEGVVLTFSLVEEMHQDSNLSKYKQRRYNLTSSDTSLYDTKVEAGIFVDHMTYGYIWAHLIAQKADDIGVQLRLGEKPSDVRYFSWRKKELLKKFKFQAPRVGDLLQRGTREALVSWHTLPFFSRSETPIASFESNELRLTSKHKDTLLFLYHLSNDRILEGCNFVLHPNKPSSKQATSYKAKFENLEPDIRLHHDVYKTNISPTGGFVDLMFDPLSFKDGVEVNDFICSDVNHFDPGLRVMYSKSTPAFEQSLLSVQNPPMNLNETMFRWSSTKISALRFAHLKPRVEERPSEQKPKWVHYDKSLIDWDFSNAVYGEKFGFSNQINGSEGLAEFSSKYFTSSHGHEVNAVIEADDKLWKTNRLFAHSAWKDLLLECYNVNSHFTSEGEANPLPQGTRLERCFGFITDTGGVDGYVIDRIKDRIKLLENNATQLENDERVISGRANMLNCIRDISSHFTYSNWYPGYIEAYQSIRFDLENVLNRIQGIEKEKMGKSLPGTVADFDIVRAVLKGIHQKYLSIQEKLVQRKIAVVENSGNLKFNEILKEVRELGVHFGAKEMEQLYSSLIESGVGVNSYQRSKLKSKCRPTRKLEVRVLGLSQQTHPYAIQTWWGEAIGTLAQDKDNAQVGSLVRLDLKKMQKEGTAKAIIANIGYASDELNDRGVLRNRYSMLSGETENQWPDPLPNDTWLKLGDDISDRKTERVVRLHVLFEKGYAFHPDLEVEIPIFDMENAPSGLHQGELRKCTIDVRRDRSKGLYRYYVTEIN